MELRIPSFLTDDSPPYVQTIQIQTEHADLREISPKEEESTMLKDIFSCLIGGEGLYIKRDKRGKYVLNCNLRDSTQCFIDRLLPTCDKFYKIQKYSESHYDFRYGKVVHTVCYSIREFLVNYIKQISEIEAIPRKTLSIVCINITKASEVISCISGIVDTITNMRGPKICTEIYRALSSKRGLPHIREPLSKLFNDSVAPVLEYIEKWVFQGKIDDPYKEFFIVDQQLSPDKMDTYRTFWEDKFTCDEENAPKFISPTMMDLIIDTGKVQAVIVTIGKKPLPMTEKLTITSIQYEGQLRQTYKQASQLLIKEMFDTYHLLDAIDMIWNVLLFNRSDLFSNFMRIASAKMKKTRDEVSPQDLEELLSIVYKPFQYLSPSIALNRIYIDVLQLHAVSASGTKPVPKFRISNDNTLWDFFAIRPNVQWPINIIIDEESKIRYEIMFRWLLVWKRLEKSYKSIWEVGNRITKMRKLNSSMVMRQISVIRFSVQTFISLFLNYLSTSVIHPSFSKFREKIQKATTIEEINVFHKELHETLEKGSFLFNKNIFDYIIKDATICWSVGKDIKKFYKSIDNDVTSEEQRAELARIPLAGFTKFKTAIRSTVSTITSTVTNEATPIFVDFALSITGNSFFSND